MEINWKHWYYFILFVLFLACANAQSIGVEHRAGIDKQSTTYLRVSSPSLGNYKLEGRYIFQGRGLGEIRITPSRTWKGSWFKVKLPLHYKPKKSGIDAFTVEPRFIIPFEAVNAKWDVWIQQETGLQDVKNAAMAIDYKPKGKFKYRLGLDSGGRIRGIVTLKL